MENSKIEWTHHTFNPWIGCTKVSAGCQNCYAETLMDTRYGRVAWGKGNARSRTSPSNWRNPFRWNHQAELTKTNPRVFCSSLADVFDTEVPKDWREDLFDVIGKTQNLHWLLLSKRANEMAQYFQKNPDRLYGNVWLGVTAENQFNWDLRLPVLLSIPASVRFVSVEPMIGPVRLKKHIPDWVICGGESGMGNIRPMQEDWVLPLKMDCDEKGVSFFFKQWGGAGKLKHSNGRELQGKTWDELPVEG